jgi:hypothetical protein
VHLPGIRMCEPTNLQIDDNQAPQTTVEKDQIHSIPFIADAKAFLPADEAEISAQFQKE